MKKSRLLKGRKKMRHETIEKTLKNWLTPKQLELSHDWYYAFAEDLAIRILLDAKKEGVDKLLIEASHKKEEKSNKIIKPGDQDFMMHSACRQIGALYGVGKIVPATNWSEVLKFSTNQPKKEQVPYKSKVQIEEDTSPLEDLKGVPLTEVETKSIMVDP